MQVGMGFNQLKSLTMLAGRIQSADHLGLCWQVGTNQLIANWTKLADRI